MNKKKFAAVLFLYVGLGISGFLVFLSYAYVEQDSLHKVISSHIIALVCSAVITGWLLVYLYRKWMPEEYEKRKDKIWFKIITPILYFLLALILNMGTLLHADLFSGDSGKLVIKGVVMNKNIEYDSKGHKVYYISISDTITKLNYYFEVKRRVYDHTSRDNIVNQDFNISKLGIIYRKDE